MGLGLRPAHYRAIAETPPELDYFEFIAENHVGSELPRQRLTSVAARYPVVGHGVSLDLLGAEPLDEAWLASLGALVREVDAAWFSDHLCWTRSAAASHHDLLPAPYAADLVGYAAERAARAQALLGVPFGIENLSSYVTFRRDELSEWEFYRRVVAESGCYAMLDVNNVYVSSVNHGFDPVRYLESVDWDRVLQVHLAGHTRRADGLLHDTHDHPVCAEVWDLYRIAWRLGGPFPTLLEWDARVPPLADAVAEALRAREMRA